MFVARANADRQPGQINYSECFARVGGRGEDVNQLLHQARISRQQGDIGAALKALQRAEKLSPGNTQVLLALGSELDAQHEPQKAVSVLQKAVALAPKNPEMSALGNAEQGQEDSNELSSATSKLRNYSMLQQSILTLVMVRLLVTA